VKKRKQEKKALEERLTVTMKRNKHTNIAIIISTAIFFAVVCAACTLGAASDGSNYNNGADTMHMYEAETDAVVTDSEITQNANELSDWRSSAEDFLSNYLSIFGIDWVGSENPDAFVLYDFAPSDDSSHAGRIYYDRMGNVIHEAPFLIGEATDQLVAWEYSLFDLDHNGIPAIDIRYVYPESGGGFPHNLYRYVNGEYRYVGAVTSPQFFVDSSGQTIVFEWNYEDLRVTRLISGEGIELIADWGQFWGGDVIDKNPSLFDMLNEPLTPIEPLTELQQSVTESVLQILSK